MKNMLFIIGVKHCGKSTVGKLLAKSLDLPFYDLDDLIEKIVGISVREYYKQYGKNDFQIKEKEALDKLLNNTDNGFVCATGGGICDNLKASTLLKSCGIKVYINTVFDTVYQRITTNGTPAFLKSNDPKTEFLEIYNRRNNLYKDLATFEIDGNNKSPKEINEIAINKLRS